MNEWRNTTKNQAADADNQIRYYCFVCAAFIKLKIINIINNYG